MKKSDYEKAKLITKDLEALTYCAIASFASEKLKKEFNDWVEKKKEYLQNEFANL